MVLTQDSKLRTQNLTDWHCHLLPSLDDGPASMEESVEMARALCSAGYATVYCTPHFIKGSYDFDNEAVRGAVSDLQGVLDKERIRMNLLPGREYYLDEFFLDQLKAPLLLGETRMLLMEIPNHATADHVKESCYRIRCSGFVPLIAHPERCKSLEPKKRKEENRGIWSFFFGSKYKAQSSRSENNSLLTYLREIGCQFQGNLGSFSGSYGERARTSAKHMRQIGLYNCFGSDGHSLEGLRAVLNG